jgi:hypothetical protein
MRSLSKLLSNTLPGMRPIEANGVIDVAVP